MRVRYHHPIFCPNDDIQYWQNQTPVAPPLCTVPSVPTIGKVLLMSPQSGSQLGGKRSIFGLHAISNKGFEIDCLFRFCAGCQGLSVIDRRCEMDAAVCHSHWRAENYGQFAAIIDGSVRRAVTTLECSSSSSSHLGQNVDITRFHLVSPAIRWRRCRFSCLRRETRSWRRTASPGTRFRRKKILGAN